MKRKALAKKSVKKAGREKSVHPLHPKRWDRERLRVVISKFSDKKVLVIGDVGVDRYTIGVVERISQEAPVPIVWVKEEKLKLGLAANVADNVKALGGKPLLAGVVGRDRAAEDFRGLLKQARIESDYLIVDRGRRTVVKERIVSDRQQLLRVDYETIHHTDAGVSRELVKTVKELLPEADAVILEDYAKGLLNVETTSAIFEAAKKLGKKVAVDPNSKSPLEFYRGAHILTPNTSEAEKLSGIAILDQESLVKAGKKLLRETLAKHVVITRGREGMAIFTKGESTIHLIPTFAREVYDVSGAGDTVIATLTLALASGASVVEAVILGNLAAGVEVGKRGTATVSRDEIHTAMDFFGAATP